MKEKDCTTCKNAYIKDGVYLICDIDGIQNDVIKNCENYESEDKDERHTRTYTITADNTADRDCVNCGSDKGCG